MHKVSGLFGNRELIIETGKMAKQADGAVTVQYGETIVLATVVGAKEIDEERDFFPLTVDYRERTYAAGRIPGGFFKREGRPLPLPATRTRRGLGGNPAGRGPLPQPPTRFLSF